MRANQNVTPIADGIANPSDHTLCVIEGFQPIRGAWINRIELDSREPFFHVREREVPRLFWRIAASPLQ